MKTAIALWQKGETMSNLIEKRSLQERLIIAKTLLDGAIKDLPSAQPEPQWIPCSERLPELGKDVLATLFHANGELGIVMVKRTTSFNPGDTYWEDWTNEYSWENENVLAWMPLPDCYKGE